MLLVDIYLLGAVIDWFVCTPQVFFNTFPIWSGLTKFLLSPHCDLGQRRSGVRMVTAISYSLIVFCFRNVVIEEQEILIS